MTTTLLEYQQLLEQRIEAQKALIAQYEKMMVTTDSWKQRFTDWINESKEKIAALQKEIESLKTEEG